MTVTNLALAVLGVPLGLALANVIEWIVHRFVLHGLGRKRSSFWSFHWHEHHQAARKHDMYDPDYQRPVFGWHAQGKEAFALALGAAGALLLLPSWPTLSLTLVFSAFDYHRKHKRAHLDPEWAREHLPWHYDHHMGPNQNSNWCVTHPWLDLLVGTREAFAGTERDRSREAASAGG